MGITGETTQTSTGYTQLRSMTVNTEHVINNKPIDSKKANTITEENVTQAGTVSMKTYARWCKNGAPILIVLTLIILIIS